MEANKRVVKPFDNLNELYGAIDSLTPWDGILEIRKLADYVYQGPDHDVQIKKPQKKPKSETPRTIVCHDMMGGYLEDRFIDGSNNHNSYHFYHWNVVDAFIYFSHHFVTIPPFGWINAAHKHGVKILGTVITENEEGHIIWNEILKTRNSIIKFADALIELALFYKFEGWLLNVENEITQTDITKLIFFVQYLTETIHMQIPNSEIIWYDSVIKTGKLKWQNELNGENECFFDKCDGIFLNYNWTDSGLNKSAIIANNRSRRKDIYVGLDVWGRGCPGGGGFQSAHALEKIRNQELSVAIFAPAWTFEYFGQASFSRLEDIFWAQLMPFLFINVPIYKNERFETTFCRGAGGKYYEYGMQITYKDPKTNQIIESNSSFYNMAMQKPQVIGACSHLKFNSIYIAPPKKIDNKEQPQQCTLSTEHEILQIVGNKITLEEIAGSTEGKNCIQFSYDLSYEGGGCLKLINNDVKSYHRLFFINFKSTRDLQARIIYQCSSNEQSELDAENEVILVLTNSIRNASFLPSNTINYAENWKMSVFQVDMRDVEEIGIKLTGIGSYYIGKIVLQETRRPTITSTLAESYL